MRNLLVLLMTGCIVGCGALPPFNPADHEQRSVTPLSDHGRILTLKEAEVWYDGQPPRGGIRFPAGDYVIEAEDDAFWYFAAPSHIEIRGTNAATFAGGIALRKHVDLAGVFAEGYVQADKDPSQKLLIWKLGSDFERFKGSKWTTNF